ncbi:NAD(P)-binding domain-containing protein [Nocardioidaceae bacterium]|nr:NAD(P)-binding domain-containing protein [Nocardioidaceae bacterium]
MTRETTPEATETTIGFIGAGNIGGTVARLAVDAGLDVVLSNSRGPETLADLAADLGEHARAGTTAEAAAADVVVLTVPLNALDDVVAAVPEGTLDGTVVLDTLNYYPERDGRVTALEEESTTTSEMVAEAFPTAHVVKAFNNIFFGHLGALARPSGSPERSVLAIAGDDEDAKRAATEVLDRLGYDALDAGPLAEGWRFQRDTAAYGLPYDGSADGRWQAATARPVPASAMQDALDQARRYRDM